MIDPDCRDGKHRACTGGTWDVELDAPTDCACECHGEPTCVCHVDPDGEWYGGDFCPAHQSESSGE